MPSTEFALLHLTTPPPASPTLRQTLAAAAHLQSAWHASRFPHQLPSAAARAARWFTDADDPAWLLTTARWPSVAVHWDWIRGVENVSVMARLTGEGEGGGKGKAMIVAGDTVLWHVEGDLFPATVDGVDGMSSPLIESAVVSVARMFVPREKRAAFAARFEEVKGVLEGYAGPEMVGYGWREDGEDGAEEDEFVVACGWESLERHDGFEKSEGFAEYDSIRELVERLDLKRYKRMWVL